MNTILLTWCGQVQVAEMWNHSFFYLFYHDLRCVTDVVNELKGELLSMS